MRFLNPALCLCLAAIAPAGALAADPVKIDWSAITVTAVPLFYPGQSSYEWLRSSTHKGAKKVKAGEACVACHDGKDAEQELGTALVRAGRLEPTPVKGKNGFVNLGVQAAFDARNLYLRYQWKTHGPRAGTEHQYLRFDGKAWKVWGFPRLDKDVQDGVQPALYEDRVSVLIDDGKVPGFAQQGCWLTCHDGSRDMARSATKAEAAADPLLSSLKKGDLRKYLPDSRSDPADWKTGRSVADIAALKAGGNFLDLVQWRAHRSHAVGMADDGYVLEYRLGDAGRDMFGGNADSQSHLPRFMWDETKTGFRSIRDDSPARKGELFLVRERNAVPFDPKVPWQAGDMVPDYLMSRDDSSGSAADNNAIASWKDGLWTVVLVRPLGLRNADDKALNAGGVYNVGFAVHDDNITTRGHHVSFVKTLGLGVKADIEAVRLP